MPPSVFDSLHFDPLVLWGAGLGLALGTLLGWLVARVRTSAYASRLEERTQMVTDLEAERRRTEGPAFATNWPLPHPQARLMAQAARSGGGGGEDRPASQRRAAASRGLRVAVGRGPQRNSQSFSISPAPRWASSRRAPPASSSRARKRSPTSCNRSASSSSSSAPRSTRSRSSASGNTPPSASR